MKELRKYESFQSVSDMDKAIDKALKEFDLKDSERAVLFKLAQFSCKFVGVSYLKNDTLAQAVGFSKRTVQRSLKRLAELGIITRIEQKREKAGGYGAFITVINPSECHLVVSPCQEAEKTCGASFEKVTIESETISFQANSFKELKERKEEIELDLTYIENSHIPQGFISTVKPFINSAKEVYLLWGKVLLASKKYAPDVLNIEEVAIQAFKQSIFVKKMRRIRKSFKGYFWGTVSTMLALEQRRTQRANLWNWLLS